MASVVVQALKGHPSASEAIQPINSAILTHIGRLKWAWDCTASSSLTQLESCDLIKFTWSYSCSKIKTQNIQTVFWDTVYQNR